MEHGFHCWGDSPERVVAMDHLASPDERKIILEQYKMYVQMTDNVSQRRAVTNQFYVTVLGGGLALISFVTDRQSFSAIQWLLIATVAFFGLSLCGSWWLILRSYRQLNSGRFKVISEIEQQLPFAPYDREWRHISKGKRVDRYIPFTHIEQWVPVALGVPYLVLLGYALVRLIW